LAVIAFSSAVIATKLKLRVNTYTSKPIMRIELLGESMNSLDEAENYSDMQKGTSSLLGDSF